MSEHVAPIAAIGFLAVHLHDAAGGFKVAPARREIAEHNARVPGIVRNQRQRFEHRVVRITVVYYFDARADPIDGLGDFFHREGRPLRRQVQPQPYADFELKTEPAIAADLEGNAALHYAAGEHDAGQWTVDVAHLLHARRGESDLISFPRP